MSYGSGVHAESDLARTPSVENCEMIKEKFCDHSS